MSAKKASKIICVKLRYDDQTKKIAGTHAEQKYEGGPLTIYDETNVVARFGENVESWWIEED